jgi:protein-S-isoprenylcysteine O-methyltransferase Ste14
MNKILGFAFGLFAYLVFLLSVVYAIGFVGNIYVPKSIDSGYVSDPAISCLIDMLLLAAFAIPHSVMARPAFKAAWTKIVPVSMERSVYVLQSSLLLLLLFWQWRPLPASIWQIHGVVGDVLTAAYWLGWLLIIVSTFLINHFDLFGLRQVLLAVQGKAYSHLPFTTRGLYRLVRHPLMLGFLIAFWAAPTMTVGHLNFALANTLYILIALQFEERDLAVALGEDYSQYQKKVPMLLPWPRKPKQ